MKPFKKILLLALSVAAIVLLWLVPGINTAKTVRYTRAFEDTDSKPATAEGTTVSDTVRLTTKGLPNDMYLTGKKYKKEHIETEAGLSRIKMEMFSRATHFHEEEIPNIPIEELLVDIDSMKQPIVVQDSVYHVVDSTASMR